MEKTYDDDRMDVAILSYNNVRQAKISPQEIPKTQQINIIYKTKSLNVIIYSLWAKITFEFIRYIQLVFFGDIRPLLTIYSFHNVSKLVNKNTECIPRRQQESPLSYN